MFLKLCYNLMNDNTKSKDPQNKQQNIISTKSNKTYLQCM